MYKEGLLIFYMFVLLFIPTKNLKSQVTIGSSLKTNQGSLLDLKEYEPATAGGANSTRGLGMPRVKLNSITDLTALGIDGDADKTAYVGMAVFHVSDKDDLCPILQSGLYVWDGEKWQNMIADNNPTDQTSWVDNGDGTGVLTDYEGNRYRTKNFGGDIWMVDNLRSTIAKTGEFIDATNGVRLNAGYRIKSENAVGIAVKCNTMLDDTPVPVKIGGVDYGLTYNTYASHFGLLYNQAQALNACPEGWSISTDAQWDALKSFLGGGTSVGKMLKSDNLAYIPVENTGFLWQGYAIGDVNNVGFNAVPAGYVNPSNEALNFSYGSFYWTSTSKKYYYLYYVSSNIQIMSTAHENLSLSVRCVKN